MNIKLGKLQREITPTFDLATCLEFSLVWADTVDDSSLLVRINAAAIGVALDSLSILPAYRPERDKILVYGRKVLARLLEKKVPVQEIYSEGTKILTAMSDRLPKRENIDEQKDFFPSPEQEM
mgnify:CR=1 FL=1